MYNSKAKRRKKRIIEIIVLSVFVLWLVFFVIDYIRYKDTNKPLITIAHRTVEFEDGTVDEYYSLGWVYREYKRRAIGDIELTSIFKRMQRPAVQSTLPLALKNYDIPENKEKLDEYKGIIYYYNYGGARIGTYKCINSDNSCTKAVSGYDEYNINQLDPLNSIESMPKFDTYDLNFAFIDDTATSNDSANALQIRRIIYLYDVANNEILAQYRNVKYSTINNYNKADGYNGYFIVQNDDGKWGIITPTSNGPITRLDFQYDSINFNETTKKYIVKKDNQWFLYDIETKEFSSGFEDIILDAYEADGKLFVKTVYTKDIGEKEVLYFNLYDSNKTPFLTEDGIIGIQIYNKFISYLKEDSYLRFINTNGQELLSGGIKLNYASIANDLDNTPCYSIEVFNTGNIVVSVPRTNSKSSITDMYYYNTDTWKMIYQKEGKVN